MEMVIALSVGMWPHVVEGCWWVYETGWWWMCMS
jgi:hypothetical protein